MAFLSLLCSVFTSDLLTLDLTLNKSCIHLFLCNPEWIDLCVTKTYLRSYMHRSLRIVADYLKDVLTPGSSRPPLRYKLLRYSKERQHLDGLNNLQYSPEISLSSLYKNITVNLNPELAPIAEYWQAMTPESKNVMYRCQMPLKTGASRAEACLMHS